MSVFEELKRRGFIAQATDEAKIKHSLENESCRFYVGFDATADSLHVGSFLQLIAMKRLQQAGHVPIVLLGTGTTLIGDPTGRTDMRKILEKDEIEKNAKKFERQISRFIDFSDGKAFLVNNGDWLLNLNYMDFLREVGRYFSVNKMLTAECVKTRLENGLSFLEFNYMLMQSYDFLKLYQNFNCTMEFGGNDQWSNIIGGVELVRRVEKKQVYGMTFKLLTTKDGRKMGKTQKGALWLDSEKCSPFEFFQYFRNIPDDDVINCLKLLTFVPIEEIEQMECLTGSDLNKAKELLAFEVTSLVHGKDLANEALKASKAAFEDGVFEDDIPFTVVSSEDFEDGGIGILNLLVLCGLCGSNSQARRLVEQGGIAVNGEKILDFRKIFSRRELQDDLILKKGKKIFHLVKFR